MAKKRKNVNDMTRLEYDCACYEAQKKLSRGASTDPARPDFDPAIDGSYAPENSRVKKERGV